MDDNSRGGGLGILGVLQIIFWVLNVLDIEPVASWSLWWVNSPLLVSVGLTAFGIVLIVILALVDRR